METYTAVTNAVGGSLGLSALVATIPLLTFFVMLLGVKARAHWSALVALAASILVAALGFHMPADLAGLSAVRGGYPHRILLRRSARGTGWLRRSRCNYRNHDSLPGR